MSTVNLRPATDYTLQQLNAIFVGAFQGYLVPIPNDLKMFAYRLRSEHMDLTESLVAEIDGQPAGLSLTARRDNRTRLAGLGVYPEFRGQGVGQLLTEAFMQPALERKDLLLLEVFQSNIKAVQLYLKNGFEIRQSLPGYTGEVPAVESPELQSISLQEAVAFLRIHGEADLPWQISADTLISLPPTARAFRLQSSVAIVSLAGEQAYLRTLVTAASARRQGQATRLLQAIAAHTGIQKFQAIPVFPEHLISPIAQKLGWQKGELGQYELWRQA